MRTRYGERRPRTGADEISPEPMESRFARTPVDAGWSLDGLLHALDDGLETLRTEADALGARLFGRGDEPQGPPTQTEAGGSSRETRAHAGRSAPNTRSGRGERRTAYTAGDPDRPRVHPRVRAHGKARIDIASRLSTRADWEELWVAPAHPFPFQWEGWKHCFEYRVEDFAAEIGFLIDVLGFPVKAISPDYAMFTSPDESLTFSVVSVDADEIATPPEAVSMQFMVADILETARELERRGVTFARDPEPIEPGRALYAGTFRTPHGIFIDLLGKVSARGHRPRPERRQMGS